MLLTADYIPETSTFQLSFFHRITICHHRLTTYTFPLKSIALGSFTTSRDFMPICPAWFLPQPVKFPDVCRQSVWASPHTIWNKSRGVAKNIQKTQILVLRLYCLCDSQARYRCVCNVNKCRNNAQTKRSSWLALIEVLPSLAHSCK